jgi:hypothetical protein
VKEGDLISRKGLAKGVKGVVISTFAEDRRTGRAFFARVYWVTGKVDTWNQKCLEVLSESR